MVHCNAECAGRRAWLWDAATCAGVDRALDARIPVGLDSFDPSSLPRSSQAQSAREASASDNHGGRPRVLPVVLHGVILQTLRRSRLSRSRDVAIDDVRDVPSGSYSNRLAKQARL